MFCCQLKDGRAGNYRKSSELFESPVYLEEVSDILCIAHAGKLLCLLLFPFSLFLFYLPSSVVLCISQCLSDSLGFFQVIYRPLTHFSVPLFLLSRMLLHSSWSFLHRISVFLCVESCVCVCVCVCVLLSLSRAICHCMPSLLVSLSESLSVWVSLCLCLCLCLSLSLSLSLSVRIICYLICVCFVSLIGLGVLKFFSGICLSLKCARFLTFEEWSVFHQTSFGTVGEKLWGDSWRQDGALMGLP